MLFFSQLVFSQNIETTDAVIHNSNSGKKFENDLVRVRITEPLKVGKYTLEKNTFLYGKCKFTENRVLLKIRRVNINGEIIECDIDVLDIDGYEGVSINNKCKKPKKVILNDGHGVLLRVN